MRSSATRSRRLLGSHDVETVAAGTAAECLELLKAADLRLHGARPVAAGRLGLFASGDAEPGGRLFLPAGHRLHRPRSVGDEEQRLRRYSKSIIIKGAKSPERLLDEVTLFLHQVVSELAGRTAEDDPQGAQPGRRARRAANPRRRGRRPQRLCADQHPRAARRARRDRPQRPGGARGARKIHRRSPVRRSIWC